MEVVDLIEDESRSNNPNGPGAVKGALLRNRLETYTVINKNVIHHPSPTTVAVMPPQILNTKDHHNISDHSHNNYTIRDKENAHHVSDYPYQESEEQIRLREEQIRLRQYKINNALRHPAPLPSPIRPSPASISSATPPPPPPDTPSSSFYSTHHDTPNNCPPPPPPDTPSSSSYSHNYPDTPSNSAYPPPPPDTPSSVYPPDTPNDSLPPPPPPDTPSSSTPSSTPFSSSNFYLSHPDTPNNGPPPPPPPDTPSSYPSSSSFNCTYSDTPNRPHSHSMDDTESGQDTPAPPPPDTPSSHHDDVNLNGYDYDKCAPVCHLAYLLLFLSLPTPLPKCCRQQL